MELSSQEERVHHKHPLLITMQGGYLNCDTSVEFEHSRVWKGTKQAFQGEKKMAIT